MQVTPQDMLFVAKLVDELCGIVLDDTKGYLVESRLAELAKARGCSSYGQLVQQARATSDRALQNQIIDAITTRETLFFRDNSPFEALQYKVLPHLIDAKQKTATPRRLRLWSAACSTGQEPYSLAISLMETIGNVAGWDIQILATDIADAAIKQASAGTYAAHEIQRGMKPELLNRYFTPITGGWRVKDNVRSMVAFQKRNLLQSFTEVGSHDIIFCRNVAIYFDAAKRRDLFNRLTERLNRGGYLFVGSSESLLDLGPRFQPQHHCRATFYQPA